MKSLRSQLDAFQIQLGSLAADVPPNDAFGAGSTLSTEAALIDSAHRSADSDARLADGTVADSAPVEMQEFFRRFGVSGRAAFCSQAGKSI